MAKVLIVSKDKESSYLLSIAIAFQKIEAEIVSGIKSLEKKFKKKSPDLVIFDISGFNFSDLELFSKFKDQKKKLPLIIVSDFFDQDIKKRTAILGAIKSLSKKDSFLGDIIKTTRKVIK